MSLPQAVDWNSYWSLSSTQQFTKISWSKKRVLKIVQPYIIREKSALDAGCGSGFFAKYFCDCGMKTTAIDYSDQALEITQKKTAGLVNVLKLSLLEKSDMSSLKSRFDLIFTDGLMEHFTNEDQDRIVSNLKLLLKDTGVIITFVPNRFSPWELIRPLYMPGIKEDPFTLNQLVRLNQRNSLDVIYRGGVNVLPFSISPEFLGQFFGMLLFTVAKKK